MSPVSSSAEVVIAGGGVAAAACAVRLGRLGLGVRLLVRPGAGVAGIEALPQRALDLLEILDEPGLVAEAGGVTVARSGPGPPLVHVDRQALARAFLGRAQARGATLEEVRRLPPASAVASTAVAVVDATGRAAAWSRPLLTDGHDVAWQFEGPPQADLALRVVHGARWWAYRLGTLSTTWAGVVVAGPGEHTVEALRQLGLDPDEMQPRGRRAARVQRAVRPVAGRRIAVGDAALAHDPIAGGGIRFALASAVAAATAVATWVDDPGRLDLAAAYYEELVTGEHARHLDARRAIHSSGGEAVLIEAEPVPDVVRFATATVEAPLAVDGVVGMGPAVRMPDGTTVRWLGSFDLLVLARLSADPLPRLVLLARLQEEGLDITAARAVVTWATRHGVLTGAGFTGPGAAASHPPDR